MKKNYFCCFVYLSLLCSCNGNIKSTNVESSSTENITSFTTEQKFIGEWVVVASRGRLEAVTGQENMSKGVEFNLTKTNQEYLLIRKGFEIVKQQFIEKDENTLIGVNSDGSSSQLKYNASTGHIIFEMSGEEMELKKYNE